MADTKTKAHKALFSTLDDVRAGMLGLQGASGHMQPMTHYVEEEAGLLWFISAKDTDLVQSLGQGGPARYCVMGRKEEVYACLTGRLEEVDNPQKLEELWSPVVAAWFDGGRADPRVALLRFALDEAQVHVATGSAIHFGIEIVRANMSTERKPDLGDVEILNFRPTV